MDTHYIGIEVKSNDPQTWNEIIIALLSEHPFESFEEKDDALWAYIQKADFDASFLNALENIKDAADLEVHQHHIERENWNETWEKQFHPVEVENICYIYAPFHEKPAAENYHHTMCIMPKMAFGTGHHSTTWLMIQSMYKECDFEGKRVLDMGCGTGVLALFARIRAAESVHAIDIDEWAIDNTYDNFAANDQKAPEYAKCGDRKVIPEDAMYDCILANINRNVLLADMDTYAAHLVPGGKLLLSGFYLSDIPVLEEVWTKYGFSKNSVRDKQNWACVLLTKSE
jgi:ribosomal protein L11 methyltransferase